jgi:hypothetical protein
VLLAALPQVANTALRGLTESTILARVFLTAVVWLSGHSLTTDVPPVVQCVTPHMTFPSHQDYLHRYNPTDNTRATVSTRVS